MSIGKDSINRAASVAVAKKKTGVNGKGTGDNTDAKTNADKAEKKETVKKQVAKKVVAKTVKENISKEVMDTIIYQDSSQVIYRDAEPNESFGIGDSMPVYYF